MEYVELQSAISFRSTLQFSHLTCFYLPWRYISPLPSCFPPLITKFLSFLPALLFKILIKSLHIYLIVMKCNDWYDSFTWNWVDFQNGAFCSLMMLYSLRFLNNYLASSYIISINYFVLKMQSVTIICDINLAWHRVIKKQL